VQIRTAEPSDLDSVHALLAERDRCAFGESEVERHYLAEQLGDPSTDRLVAVNGGVVGYGSLDAGAWLHVAAPDAGVGRRLLAALEERAHARGFGAITTTAVEQDRPLTSLIEHDGGFEHRGDMLRMWRRLDVDVPDAALREGITLRTYGDADARTVQSLLDTVYASWDDEYIPRAHDDWLRWMTAHAEFDAALWLLAERDGELVGCALNWREHAARGWVKDLAVCEPERGQGLATALLHATFAAYRQRGVTRVGLKVDSNNPTGAVRLYARLGFETDRRYGIWVKTL
jgi:mycothiol synthase